jgi:glycosyltransferase involved in cell wall biosynthesis
MKDHIPRLQALRKLRAYCLSAMHMLVRRIAYALYPSVFVQVLQKLFVEWFLNNVQKRQVVRTGELPRRRFDGARYQGDVNGLTASLIFSRTHWDPNHIHHRVGSGRMQQEIIACLQSMGIDTEFAGDEDKTFSRRITDADLVVTLPSALTRIAERVRGVTVVLPCNTHVLVRTARLVESSRKWHLPSEYYPWVPMYLRAYDQADYLLVAENDEGIENFAGHGIGGQKIKRYNNCIDQDVWKAASSRRNAFTFVFWASYAGLRKGIPALAGAWQEWFTDQDAELHIYGMPTPATEVMFNGSKQGSPIPGLHLHLGVFPAQDPGIIDFLGSSHVGILPTLEDAQPASLLEMASCGLPIITTREAGVEFSEDFCRYVSADSVEELARAFQYWYARKERTEDAGMKARAFILQHHTWDHFHQRFSRIVREILVGEPTPQV